MPLIVAFETEISLFPGGTAIVGKGACRFFSFFRAVLPLGGGCCVNARMAFVESFSIHVKLKRATRVWESSPHLFIGRNRAQRRFRSPLNKQGDTDFSTCTSSVSSVAMNNPVECRKDFVQRLIGAALASSVIRTSQHTPSNTPFSSHSIFFP